MRAAEHRQRRLLLVFEDQVGFDLRYLGAGGEMVECQVAQMVGVAHRHVDEEVEGAGDVEDADGFLKVEAMPAKGRHLRA